MHTHQPTLPGFAPSEATPKTGAADVPVCQVPKGLSKAPDQEKDKLLRSFANGNVCASINAAGHSAQPAPECHYLTKGRVFYSHHLGLPESLFRKPHSAANNSGPPN